MVSKSDIINKNNSPWGKGPWGDDRPNSQDKKSPDDDLEKLLNAGSEKIKNIFGGGGNGFKGGKSNKAVFSIIALIAVALWLASGFYTVNTKEEAVILRFGKYVRTAQAGLNYHLPYPIEQAIKMRVTDHYQDSIGDQRPISRRYMHSETASNGNGILMLTGDENIVQINFEVQWLISDLRKFLFNVNNPRKTLRDTAESTMREVVGTSPINDVLSDDRTSIQLHAKKLLQDALNAYDAGINIQVVNMRAVPPKEVDSAFKDVQAAKINKEETINKAIAYRNDILPKARGDAEKLLQEAEGYKQEVIAKAEGEANRFSQIYNRYKNARSVTKKRMYLETMEEVLGGMDKIILDNSQSGSGVIPYLPLTELTKKSN